MLEFTHLSYIYFQYFLPIFFLIIAFNLFFADDALSGGSTQSFYKNPPILTKHLSYKGAGGASKELSLIRAELEKISRNKTIPWEAIVALALGLSGIFKIPDYVDKKFLRKPKWGIDLKLEAPDSHKISLRSPDGSFICDTYYFRVRVTNTGNIQMEDVEVIVEELHRRKRGGSYEKIHSFLPLNLVWAHNHLLTMPKIQPSLFKHCDFSHILQSRNINLSQFGISTSKNVVMVLDTSVQPNTGSHIILPGKYKIKLVFAANNLSPKTIWLKLEFKNVWDNDERKMFSKNVVMEEVVA